MKEAQREEKEPCGCCTSQVDEPRLTWIRWEKAGKGGSCSCGFWEQGWVCSFLQLQEGNFLLCSAQVSPHLQSCLQPWGPQHQKDLEVLEQGQVCSKGAPLPWSQAGRAGGAHLEGRRLWGDLRAPSSA